MANTILCPICEGGLIKKLLSKKLVTDISHYQEFNGLEFVHFKCDSCGFAFLPKPENLDLSKYYDSEYYASCDYRNQESSLGKLFCKRLTDIMPYLKGKKILDIGCALGFSLKAYSKLGFDAYGMEVSKSSVLAAQENTKYEVVQSSIEEKTKWEDNFFDAVTMFDILEHTSQPKIALNEVKRIMKSQGILYISTLNFDGIGRKFDTLNWPLLSPPGHMSYFSRKTLLYLLRSLGFSIVQTRCFGIASNDRKFQRINSLMIRKFPSVGKIFELTNLGDYIEVIAVKS